MLLQRVFVWLYSCFLFLQTRVKHKKWLALVAAAVYVALRASGKWSSAGNGPDRPVLINALVTESKDFGNVHMAPTPVLAVWTNHTFECVGWKRTHTCKVAPEAKDSESETDATDALLAAAIDGPTLEPEKDFLGCTDDIATQMAGYCIVRNRTSGDLFKLMISECDSIPTGAYTCDMARAFSEFGLLSVAYEHTPVAPSLALPSIGAPKRNPTNGVLMIVYDKVLPSAYATIRMLRVQGCELPVELWYRPDEMSIDNPIIHHLLSDFNVRMRPIFDLRAQGFHVKPYAVYYSNFDNVLLLDADNLPAKDPTYLFDEPEFLRTGAIFWPDYWQPSNSLFQLTNTSLLWQLTGVDFVDMFEQESGQVLINRLKSKRALDKLMYYSTHEPRLMESLHLIWGDKDLFRLAWLNASQPFHYIQFPPAVGGLDLTTEKGIFCGLAMIQHDVQGDLVFFHRNSIKLDGSLDQPRIMTHIQEFALDGDPTDYRIFQAVFAHKECCYYIGTQSLTDGRPAASITPIDATIFAAIEDLAIEFSIEARKLILADAKTHRMYSSDGGPSVWSVQHIVALFLLLYVALIMLFVWCKARPARERLPSRWKPMESKES